MTLEVIAEGAQGFLGDPFSKAANLIRYSKAAGADVAKLQLVYADELCTPDQKHYELSKALERPDAKWGDLVALAHELGIRIYVDVFGPRSASLADDLGVDGIKLHSTDIMNQPLLEHVAALSTTRIVLSAGGTFMHEISRAIDVMSHKDLVVMHGFQGYPTGLAENQIARVSALSAAFPECAIGFADHVAEGNPERFWLSAVAVGAGVTVLEKHITTALVARDEDYESALNPDEFALYVRNMKDAAAAFGETSTAPDFGMHDNEVAYRHAMKKHVVAARDLAAGHTVTEADLAMKRSPSSEGVLLQLEDAVGKTLASDVSENSALKEVDLS